MAEDGGPAFPVNDMMMPPGMTLRDWFAGMALTGIVTRYEDLLQEDMVTESYYMADLMLEAREGKEEA